MWEQSASDYKKGISQKFQTIDSLYETKSVNGNTVFEVMIAGLQLVPGTKTAIMTVQDTVGNSKIAEMYLHQKYYFLLDPEFRCLTDNVQRIIRFHSVRYIETQNTFRFLPSENMIILLTDADQSFISKYFTSAFAEINAPNPGRSQSVQDVNIWAKIVQIGSAHPARVNGRYKKLTITLSDKSGGDTVQFILWDEQIELAGLFKKGDQLGIVQPWVSYNNDPTSDGATLEYGSNTIIFVLPAKIDVIFGTGNYVTKDDMGVLDYKFYPERILIKDLQPKMSNLTLFGRIVAMSQNMPLSRDGKLMDRYAIRLLDSSGTIDITVWDRLAKLTTSCRLGEYILLTNLTTSERKSGNVIYVNATKALGTEIHRSKCISNKLH
ncbi:hypothetical protein BKA69DRAFT_394701 [Paraphysoderma sedebokerense]|nr:hypothetical protein BKA69DRAFT_394701 [Paraphysoderma sedebokerense]